MNIGINKITGLREQIRQFITSDNILGTMSGVTIAIATGTMIQSFVKEIIFPSIYYILKYKTGGEFSPINSLNVNKFLKEFITFLFVLIVTFVFVKYVLDFIFNFKETNDKVKQ